MQGGVLEQQSQTEFTTSLQNMAEQGKVARSQEAIILLDQGRKKLDAEDIAGALSDFETALLLFSETEYLDGMVLCRFAIGNCYRKKREYKKAYEYFKTAGELFEKIGNLELLAGTLLQLAITAQDLGEPHQQILFGERAANLFRQMGNIDC